MVPATLAPGDDTFIVSGVLTHTGGPTTDEVVQVHMRSDRVSLVHVCSSTALQVYGSFSGPSVGAASVPRQQLLAFVRLHDVSAGTSVPVSFDLPRSALELVPPDGALRVSAGVWTLTLGGGPPANAAYGGSSVLTALLTVE